MIRALSTPLSYRLSLRHLEQLLRTDYVNAFPLSLSILEHLLRIDRTAILSDLDNHLSESEYKAFDSICWQIKDGIPLSYILHTSVFFGLNFFVAPTVLIPRPETELLIELLLREINIARVPNLRLLEFGTGSGCIPVSLINNTSHQNYHIVSTDVSRKSLKVARYNAEALLGINYREKLTFINQDIFSKQPKGNFDIIFSNPPYIPINEYNKLGNSLYYEPKEALTDGSDGLLFYRKFGDIINLSLKTEGICFFEIHSNYAEEVKSVFEETIKRSFKSIIHRDIFGRNRVIELRFNW